MKLLPLLFAAVFAFNSVFAKDGNSPEAVASILPASHAIWNQLLQTHVSASGAVNYKGLQADRAKLDRYLNILATQPPQSDWSRAAKMSYWINAYNAFTVKLILDNYPLKSIRDIEKPWDTAFITIGSKSYTLNDIEHKILRPEFQDPRIHFAVNCASQSCPELLNEAFVAAKLEKQLDAQTRAFVNNPKHNKLNGSSASVSQLFNWYGEDFTKKGTVVDFLNKYAKTPLQSGASVSFAEYDWGLNK